MTPYSIHPPGAETASGQTNDFVLPSGAKRTHFALAVASVGGTSPSMVLKVQGKTIHGSYVDYYTSPPITAPITVVKIVDPMPPTYRVAWVITGTNPSFNFDLDAVIEE